MTQPILRTDRLMLVPLADEHFDLELELDSDPEVLHYLTGRAATRDEVEQAHIRRRAAAQDAPGLGFWVGFASRCGDAIDGGFVGWWLLRPPNGPDQPAELGATELGYRLLRSQWRRGYASEGSRELLRYGFDDLHLDRIFAQTMAVNAGSRAVMESVGMTFVRSFTSAEAHADPVDGADQGEVEYSISREEWAADRSGRGS